ncbi:MAG: hypothetical protein OEZ15_08535 [Gammaproteobacteria bacterium]|nr:hypothetical protein [Gammaproteobacteria bacterium]
MKSTILERYPCTDSGQYIIDINAGEISYLYNDFDKYTPYVRKELDDDLVDYLIESASELDKEAFIIRLNLVTPPVESMKSRITASINSYFLYLKTIEIEELGRNIRTSLIFFIIGLTLLSLSVWVNEQLTIDASVITKVFAEGLTVAAWVSMWEALANFLVNWAPFTRRIKLYERIATAPVQFISTPANADQI